MSAISARAPTSATATPVKAASRRDATIWLGAIFVLAFGLRLAYVAQIRANPFFSTPVIDAGSYDLQAQVIARGEWIGAEVFAQAPLYPYFLGLVYRLFGHDYYLARVVQALVGSLSCLLLLLLAQRVAGVTAGRIAGLIAAAYGTLIFYDAELLRPVLIILLNLLLLHALLSAAHKPHIGRWALAGLLLGLSVITRENILLFGLMVPLWLWYVLRQRLTARKMLLLILVFFLGTAAVILPVAVRNYLVSGEVVPVSALGGINFYIGNNPRMDQTVAVQPGWTWDSIAGLPARQAGLFKASEQSAWFYGETLRLIAADPLRWLGNLARKFVFFWNAFELDPNNDIDYFRARSIILRLLLTTSGPLLLPLGIVGPLALLGIFLAGRRRPGFLLLSLYTLAWTASCVLFHVRARYRLPVVPALIVFAAYGFHRLVGMVRAPEKKPFYLALGGLAVLICALNIDAFSLRKFPRFPTQLHLGTIDLEQGRVGQAETELRQALRDEPRNPDAWDALAILLERTGRTGEALDACREAVRLAPGYRTAWHNLGYLLYNLGRKAEAEVAVRTALDLDPSYAIAWNTLGAIEHDLGRDAEAEEAYRRAVRAKPDYAIAWHNLGLTLADGGRWREATEAFGRALRFDPANAEYRQGYDYARKKSGLNPQ